ncbi:MAG TPA: response regulator [Bacteroidia bacterium]|jgi:CheY-like chemotaxis protein
MSKKEVTCFLIDDDPDDREIFCMALADLKSKVNCVHVNDGAEALERLQDLANIPDYIFIDMNMPRMNGKDCLVEIKKLVHMQGIPVYMYSTSADPEAVAETHRLGAAGFIVKPTSVAELTKTLNFCLK